jgi:hypothetical protein
MHFWLTIARIKSYSKDLNWFSYIWEFLVVRIDFANTIDSNKLGLIDFDSKSDIYTQNYCSNQFNTNVSKHKLF